MSASGKDGLLTSRFVAIDKVAPPKDYPGIPQLPQILPSSQPSLPGEPSADILRRDGLPYRPLLDSGEREPPHRPPLTASLPPSSPGRDEDLPREPLRPSQPLWLSQSATLPLPLHCAPSSSHTVKPTVADQTKALSPQPQASMRPQYATVVDLASADCANESGSSRAMTSAVSLSALTARLRVVR